MFYWKSKIARFFQQQLKPKEGVIVEIPKIMHFIMKQYRV